jgi:hypothetical protein
MSDPGQDQKQPQFTDLSGAQSSGNADLIGHLFENEQQAEDRTHGRLAEGGVIEVSVQGSIQRLDPFRSPGSDIGQGARLHLSIFAKGLAEEDGRGRSAIGNSRNIHACSISHKSTYNNYPKVYFMPTLVTAKYDYSLFFKYLTYLRGGSPVGGETEKQPQVLRLRSG